MHSGGRGDQVRIAGSRPHRGDARSQSSKASGARLSTVYDPVGARLGRPSCAGNRSISTGQGHAAMPSPAATFRSNSGSTGASVQASRPRGTHEPRARPVSWSRSSSPRVTPAWRLQRRLSGPGPDRSRARVSEEWLDRQRRSHRLSEPTPPASGMCHPHFKGRS